MDSGKPSTKTQDRAPYGTQEDGVLFLAPGKADYTGQRFGRLVVLGLVSREKTPKWRCKCDCGSTTDVFVNHLRSGRTTSCGCRMREANLARRGKAWSPERRQNQSEAMRASYARRR